MGVWWPMGQNLDQNQCTGLRKIYALLSLALGWTLENWNAFACGLHIAVLDATDTHFENVWRLFRHTEVVCRTQGSEYLLQINQYVGIESQFRGK